MDKQWKDRWDTKNGLYGETNCTMSAGCRVVTGKFRCQFLSVLRSRAKKINTMVMKFMEGCLPITTNGQGFVPFYSKVKLKI